MWRQKSARKAREAAKAAEHERIAEAKAKAQRAEESTQVEKDQGETCVVELGELAQASWTPIGQPFEKKGVMLTYGGGADGKQTELLFVCDRRPRARTAALLRQDELYRMRGGSRLSPPGAFRAWLLGASRA